MWQLIDTTWSMRSVKEACHAARTEATVDFDYRFKYVHVFLLAIAATLMVAIAANAQKTFSMVGEWAQNRGVLVDIPINGGHVICEPAAEPKNALDPLAPLGDHGGCVGAGAYPPGAPVRFPWPRTPGQAMFGRKPVNGGIKGSAVITTTGTAGSFTIPPHAFLQAAPTGINSATVMLVPTVVQLQTVLGAAGPANSSEALIAPTPSFFVQYPAKFMKDAWSKDPGQAGPGLTAAKIRPAANFSWCPATGTGAPGGLCVGTTLVGGTGVGPVDGIIRYTAGVNKFGGTMAMMLQGSGSVSLKVGSFTVPATSSSDGSGPWGRTMLPLLAHLLFVEATKPQANGAGYAFTNTRVLGSAPIHLDYLTVNHVSGVNSGGGLIFATGPLSGGTAPPDVIRNYGFPWTTGAVSVMNVEIGPNLSNLTSTLTAQGYDGRTPGGNGSITLVAGGTTHRMNSGSDFASIDVVTLRFNDGTNASDSGGG